MGEAVGTGDTLGRYELLLPLAQGGTAAVWIARIRGTRGAGQELVALKMILADLADDEPGSQSMLFDEARTISQIDHANIARVIEFGEENEVLYLAMEFVDGEPLHVLSREAMKRDRALPLSIAAAVISQVCAGLHAAHELVGGDGHHLGLVHRDVSPQNILIGLDGVVKLVDFGVAKINSATSRTTVGQLKGKTAFMAPEQASGAPVDRRTDVFALGVVLYQAVTGKLPFAGENEFAVLRRITDSEPAPRARTQRADCPVALEAVIARALAKPVAERFASVSEFEAALARAVPKRSSVSELADYLGGLVATRTERRRRAIDGAIAEADERTPGPRQLVDPDFIARASEHSLIGLDEADFISEFVASPSAPPVEPQRALMPIEVAPPEPSKREPAPSEPSDGELQQRFIQPLGFKLAVAGLLALAAVVGIAWALSSSSPRAAVIPSASPSATKR